MDAGTWFTQLNAWQVMGLGLIFFGAFICWAACSWAHAQQVWLFLTSDETIAIYSAKILASPEHLVLLNNKHPMVPLSTLYAAYRLVLHGLSTEMLHSLLMRMASGRPRCTGRPMP